MPFSYNFGIIRIFAIVLVALSSISATAMAETLKWRSVSHISETHAYVLNETGGYTVGAGKGSGVGFFPGDQIATVVLGFSIDYLKGEGDFIAYETYSFSDGTALTLRRLGKTRVADIGAEFAGEFSVVSGTGRFAGAKGHGKFTGKRVAPLSSGADQYFDYTAEISLPAK